MMLMDDLSIGPIDRTDGEARTRWLQDQFGADAYQTIANIDGFWSEVASPEHRIVAYVSRRDAREYAGLLELLRQRGDAPLEVVDVTDVVFDGPNGRRDLERSLGIANLDPAEVIARGLLESAAPLATSSTLRYTQNWARLRQENASLRIIENGILVSAPITHFDVRLVSLATSEWQPTMQMLEPIYSTQRAEGIRAPPLRFLLSRLAALVAAGLLEGKGDLLTFDGLPTRTHLKNEICK